LGGSGRSVGFIGQGVYNVNAGRQLALFVSGCVLFLSGCSIGPGVIRQNLVRYNQAVTDTENEQFLLNLVRLKYRDPPKIIAVTGITSQFTFDSFGGGELVDSHYSGLAASAGKITNAFSTLTFGPFQGRLTDVPSITMTPQTGADFTKGLVAPIPLERIVLLANTGWDLDRLLRLFVHNMNGVENAPHLTGGGGEHKPDFEEFRSVAETLGRLQRQSLLELTTNPHPVALSDLSEPYKLSKPPAEGTSSKDDKGGDFRAADLITAANNHYMFHYDKKDNSIVLSGTATAYDMIIHPDAWARDGGEWESAAAKLKLERPGASDREVSRYRLIQGDGGHLNRKLGGRSNDIVVGTRSTLAGMVFLSKGVEAPPEHYQQGLVAMPLDEQGQPFDWTQVTDSLFRVHVQKCKPKNAFVAVKYRDYWFYICDNDLTSKSSFNLLLETLNVQVAPGVGAAPILTLSASGPITR